MTFKVPDVPPEQLEQMAALYNALITNPQTRESTLKALKQAIPELPIPEVDMTAAIEGRVNEKVKGLEDQLAARDKADKEAKINAEIAAQKREIVDSGYCTEEEIPEVEKLMQEKLIPDYRTAAQFFSFQRQDSIPTSSINGLPTRVMEDTFDKARLHDMSYINTRTRELAEQALNDVRRQGRRFAA